MHTTITCKEKECYSPLVPIANCKKVLYMSHLALGDYIYQGAFLQALASQHPHIELDIWLDDCRSDKKPWHTGRNHSLTQWLSSELHINHVYPIVPSEMELNEQLKLAYQKDYDAIIYVATTRTVNFARTALKIVNRGKVFGTLSPKRLSNLLDYSVYNRLDGIVTVRKEKTFKHITDFYQAIFSEFFGFNVEPDQRQLRLMISNQIHKQCAAKLAYWKQKYNLVEPNVIFINHLATNSSRSWKRSQLGELLKLAGKDHPNSLFILNSPPYDFQSLVNWVESNHDINHLPIEVFTAKKDFFELPGLMSLCNLVISVETAIMHLASSLNIKQIALIRQSALAHCWRPLNNSLILLGKKRVEAIEPDKVFNAIKMAKSSPITKKSSPRGDRSFLRTGFSQP